MRTKFSLATWNVERLFDGVDDPSLPPVGQLHLRLPRGGQPPVGVVPRGLELDDIRGWEFRVNKCA